MVVAVLTAVVAHAGQPIAPHDLWTAWNTDPLPLLALLLAGVFYGRGRAPRRAGNALGGRAGNALGGRGGNAPGGRGGDAVAGGSVRDRRPVWFALALAALFVALVSPLDALSGSLAAAHMLQHILLVLVAAPLLALSAPSSAMLRGAPLPVRRAVSAGRRRLGVRHHRLRLLRNPVVALLLHVATLWLWHAAVPYDAAVSHGWLHGAEHATFVITGVLFWRVVVGPRGPAERVSQGFGVLLIFGMAMQGVLLSALMTFSPTPWYTAYTTTTQVWGLTPLADQQLAGAIMWVPAGFIHLAVALTLLIGWLRSLEVGQAAA